MQMRAISNNHSAQGATKPRGEGKWRIGRISVFLVQPPFLCLFGLLNEFRTLNLSLSALPLLLRNEQE